ncbi:MAG: sugar transferase [Saprospiraceae bacterium]|nr:sugar transferase [Saprospiraceae bacterium]
MRLYPKIKRLADILAASAILLLISPFLLLVAIAIKLESKGPIFYTSKRVGKNFEVFDFYKFRSMKSGADKEILKIKDQMNQYTENIDSVKAKAISFDVDEKIEDHFLVSDEGLLIESDYLKNEISEEANSFVKIKDDPRITKVGQFIRNTSIDELPQLINVLKGNMSLVGNRPLPLYEAEKLTSDEWVKRFSAPAGITGYWQVTERGKSGVGAESRKRLDIEYAEKCNFWLDLWILVKTPLAVLQKENV